MLFDLESDPGQRSLISDAQVEAKMIAYLTGLMQQADAPLEQFA